MTKLSQTFRFIAAALLSAIFAQAVLAAPPKAGSVTAVSSITEGSSVVLTAHVTKSSSQQWTSGVMVIYGKAPSGTETSLGVIPSGNFSGGWGNSATFSYTPPTSGLWKFRAQMQGAYYDQATYQSGPVDTSYTSYKSVTVNAVPGSPTVSLFTGTPGNPYIGETITLAASASDADGTIASVEFRIGTTVIATDYTAPYTCTYTKTTSGTVNFTATATDNQGKKGHNSAAITWRSLPNISPLAVGDRWVKANTDDAWDYVEDVVVTQKNEYSFENYYYGSPELGSGAGMVFHDFNYYESCYYYYTPIYDYVWDFIWNSWGFFGDNWTWIGSWWPSYYYYYECDYEIMGVTSRFEFQSAQVGKEYQIQKSPVSSTPTWTNVGGAIVAAVSSISRQIGEWDGIAYVPTIARIVLLNRSLDEDPDYVDATIADMDGDGMSEVERTIEEPQVANVESQGSVEGEEQSIFSVMIPVGVAINPTGGKLLTVKVKAIGDVIKEKVVEYVVTGQVTLPISVDILAPNDSKFEVQIIFKSSKEGIFPDENQHGVNGGLVPSNKEDNPQKHYVSPKATGSDYVELVFATDKTDAQFQNEYEWDGAGTAVSGSPKKRRVSRSTAGKHTVTVKKKSDGSVVDLMNVWVVWSSITKKETQSWQWFERTQNYGGQSLLGLVGKGGYAFNCDISPSSMFNLNDDVPNLTLENSPEFMIVAPSEGKHVLENLPFFKGADRQWDMARKIRVKILNPGGVPPAGLMPVPGHLHAGQPSTTPLVVENWPANALVANDDVAVALSEDNNPYRALDSSNSGAESFYVWHEVGEIASEDDPAIDVAHAYGSNGDTLEYRLHFKEYARLYIAGEWLNISDYFEWRVHWKVRKSNGKWANDGSVIALNNSGW